jgi:hypothetical protein
VIKRLAILVALIVVLAGLLLSGDSKASIADTNIPNNDLASIVNQTDSATATITITMRTPPSPEE